MRTLLNTLFVTQPEAKFSLSNRNIVIIIRGQEVQRYPLVNLESIVSFSYHSFTPSLIGECLENGINVSFISPYGKFLGRLVGETKGNVLLRREHYRKADNPEFSLNLAKTFVKAKVTNCIRVLKRFNYSQSNTLIKNVIDKLFSYMKEIDFADDKATLRGVEGFLAKEYFSGFKHMMLCDDFVFTCRSKHPPKDYINSLLSLGYTLLLNEITSALESVGLDSYVGFYHVDISGRKSLSFDLMEELRAVFVDKFILNLINLKQITLNDFGQDFKLTKEGLRKFLTLWHEKNQKEIFNSVYDGRIKIGLIPYAQAMFLARYLREESSEYLSFKGVV